MNNPEVSIIFLVFNGLSDHFRETLAMVEKQKTGRSYEIIAIDSGSTDGTVEFLKAQPEIKLREIPNSEFGHSKTRQLGAELARGDYLLYLTQDATPKDENWLDNLLKKLTSQENIMAVSSRILPRPDALALRKYNVLAEWSSGKEDFVISAPAGEDFKKLEGDKLWQYLKLHDVSSAYKREYLVKYGFLPLRPGEFGEDKLAAKDILERGYSIAYAAKSCVYHSHSYGLKTAYQRNRSDGQFSVKCLKRSTVTSIWQVFNFALKLFVQDFKALSQDKTVSPGEKLKNALYSPLIHFAEMLGQYQGNKP